MTLGRCFRHVFFVTDLEGAAGVSNWSQTRVPGPKLQAARKLLTNEINSVVEGLYRKAEALELLPDFKISVWDGHGHVGTVFEELDPRVTKYKQGDPRGCHGLYAQALGEDPPMDAVGFIGQHAMAGTGGNLCHTYSSQRVSRYVLNGRDIGELGTRGLLAWSMGVPTVFVSGDDVACREGQDLVPGIVAVSVKRSLGVVEAESISPVESCQLLLRSAGRILDLDPEAPSLRPTFLPKPPYVYEKLYLRRWGLIPRKNETLRGGDLREVLTRVE